MEAARIAGLAQIAPGIVDGVVHAKVELIDDDFMEWRRPIALSAPIFFGTYTASPTSTQVRKIASSPGGREREVLCRELS